MGRSVRVIAESPMYSVGKITRVGKFTRVGDTYVKDEDNVNPDVEQIIEYLDEAVVDAKEAKKPSPKRKKEIIKKEIIAKSKRKEYEEELVLVCPKFKIRLMFATLPFAIVALYEENP